jgi:hypothetical protein
MPKLECSCVWIGLALATTAFAPSSRAIAQEKLHPTVSGSPEQSTDVKEGIALLAKQLQSRGWTERAAQKYGKLNGQFIINSRGRDSKDIAIVVDRLARIARMPAKASVFRAIEEYPELATVMAWSSSPETVFEAWTTNTEQRSVLLSILLVQDDPERVTQMASVWKRHGRAIADCWRLGWIGVEAVFVAAHRDDRDDEYDRWIADLFQESSFIDPGRLAEKIALVLNQGDDIRSRLRSDPEFRRSFRAILWPRLVAVTKRLERPLGIFLRHHHIWDLLARTDGVELATIYGAIPADLLFGSGAYPKEIQERIISLLKRKNRVAVMALMDPRLREDGNFCDLLRRPLPDSILLRFFDDLLNKEKAPVTAEFLDKTLGKKDEQIIDEYKEFIHLESWDESLPAYVKIPKRWFAGEPLDSHDLPTLAVDALCDLTGWAVDAFGPKLGIPPGTVSTGIDWTKQFADELLQAQTKAQHAAQKEQAKRISESMSPRETGKFIDDSLLVDAIVRTLTAVRNATATKGESKDQVAWRTLKFFYSTTAATAATLRSLELEEITLKFAQGNHLFLVPRSRVAESFAGRSHGQWADHASERWLLQLVNQR